MNSLIPLDSIPFLPKCASALSSCVQRLTARRTNCGDATSANHHAFDEVSGEDDADAEWFIGAVCLAQSEQFAAVRSSEFIR
ncbi:MAG: hypothetical protein P4L99_16685 [Chthoniobacter sp.]|nr:hypothetical protein [Chthoniobacter sp.]